MPYPKKLDAIRNELMKVQTHTTIIGKRYDINTWGFNNFVENLWEALGEKDPRVQCKGCLESQPCRAYVEPDGMCPHELEVEP